MHPGQTIAAPYGHRLSGLRIAGLREIFAIDLRTLALFRLGLGLLLILDLALRARDLSAHYTDMGVLPRELAVGILSPGAFSLHLLNGTVWFQAALFVLAGLFAAMLMAGYRTRLATIASWALLLSLQNRNPHILSGGDSLLVLLTFWAMFLPLGARFSVDVALDRRTREMPNAHFSVGTLALLVQGMSVYLFSALLKSDPQWIPDGTALYYALQLDDLVTPFALWLRQFADLLQGLTWYVWTLELIGPILIFSPIFHRTLRVACLAAFVTMHVGFFLCLELGLFPFVAILMNLAFVPGWMWDRLAGAMRPTARSDLRIFYEEGCGFCHKVCRLLTTFLILPGVPIRPAQSDPKAAVLLKINNSWVVSDGPDRDYLEWDAVRHLVACSPLFWPLAKLMALPQLQGFGDAVYQWIARNRPVLAQITAVAMPWRPVQTGTGPWAGTLAGLLLALVTFQNLTTLPGVAVRMPEALAGIRQTLGLHQNWTMFAPRPEMASAWPIILGELRDHTVVDVYRRRPGLPSWAKPEIASAAYENDRWRNYLTVMWIRSNDTKVVEVARQYARYLCRSWNAGAPPGKELSVFNIYFNIAWTPPDYRPRQPKSRLVRSHDCFG